MKGMLRILLVPFVTLAFAGAVAAQGTSSSTTPSKSSTASSTKSSDTTKSTEKKSAAAKIQRVRGELTAADAKAGTAKVKMKDKELSLNADSQEAKDSLAKMKVGDNVRVAYTETDGKLMLKSISKTKLPATKAGSTSSTSSSTKSSTASDTKPSK